MFPMEPTILQIPTRELIAKVVGSLRAKLVSITIKDTVMRKPSGVLTLRVQVLMENQTIHICLLHLRMLDNHHQVLVTILVGYIWMNGVTLYKTPMVGK